MSVSKKGGGSKLSRSEVVTVRFDPRLRFGLELAARKQRRTVSSFIEWAVDKALSEITVEDKMDNRGPYNIHELLGLTWHVHPADRLVKLGEMFPELLTYDEECSYKTIVENRNFFWKESWTGDRVIPDFNKIRENWDALQNNTWTLPDQEE